MLHAPNPVHIIMTKKDSLDSNYKWSRSRVSARKINKLLTRYTCGHMTAWSLSHTHTHMLPSSHVLLKYANQRGVTRYLHVYFTLWYTESHGKTSKGLLWNQAIDLSEAFIFIVVDEWKSDSLANTDWLTDMTESRIKRGATLDFIVHMLSSWWKPPINESKWYEDMIWNCWMVQQSKRCKMWFF